METVEARWALEATTDCVILLDRDLRVRYVNRRTATLNDTVPLALVGRLHAEVWPSTKGTEVERRYQEVLDSGLPQSFRHTYRDEPEREVVHDIHAFPQGDGVAVFFRDVTQTVRREKESDLARESLSRALEDADIGVWSRTLDATRTVDWSPRMRAHFGVAPDEIVDADTFDRHVHTDDCERTQAVYSLALRAGLPYDAIYRTIGFDGQERTVHARGRAVYDSHGNPVRFDGFTLDVTERRATERRLAEAKAQLDSLLESVEIGAWVIEVGEDRMTGDAKALAMFGLDAEPGQALPADRFRERIYPPDFRKIHNSFSATQDGVWKVDFRTVHEHGMRWLNARGVPELDASGRLVRVPGIVVDVTELKAATERLEQAESRQRFRVELTDALRGLDDAQEIVDVGCRMVGDFLRVARVTFGLVDDATETIETFTPYAAGVEPLEGLFTFDDYGRQLLDEVRKGRLVAVSDTEVDPLTRNRNASVYVPLAIRSFVIVPLLRGTPLAATFAVHDRVVRHWSPEVWELIENVAARIWDALQRARAEDRLRALNAELEDRVRERTAELEAFTSAVSHDLRGPLRNIHGIGRMLLDDAADRLNDDDRRLLERQSHNALRLSAMVDALLKLARLGQQPLNAVAFDLTALAKSVGEELLAHEPDRGCRIEVAPAMEATGDRRLVRLVLQNLLENACKFSPEGGAIRVGQEPDGTFFVVDQGVGFDMAYASKLFQPFERLVSEKQFPGTGVGLANVRRIVERHGGRVWAESEPGAGAIFRFTLG